MVKRNKHMAKLQSGYLFPEIGRRKREFMKANPDAKIISLGIGNTTQPLTPHIVDRLSEYTKQLGTEEGYTGYDDDEAAQDFLLVLKEKIRDLYNGIIDTDEIIVTDGAKPDTGRLQVLFGNDVKMAVQDPSYPVYVDSAVMMGQTGLYNDQKLFDGITYLPCTAENGFFPDLSVAKDADLIFFCSPNNPTGAVATKEQLKELVDFAKENNSIIIFDAAYSAFVKDPNLPRSIFEIEGARKVAIEINSLSKPAGFTGVRLGWTIIPKELKFDDGSPVINDFKRITNTLFNGASNIAQQGAIAALDEIGLKEMEKTIDYYLANAKIIKEAIDGLGFECYGGENAPYVWVRIPGKTSWETFDEILNNAHIVCTPGSGFGPAGEGFVRFSAFANKTNVLEAVERLKKNLKK